jgi:biopolymer transport protein ExbD
MAFETGGLDRTQASINVTPLIDVLLVILIIFMVITPILTKALQSDIPQKVDQPIPEEYSEKQLVVHVRADGRVFLNRDDVGLLGLPERLRSVFEQRGGKKTLFLSAEDAAIYGTVIQVMDLCRGAGAETIGIVPDSIQTTP